jgi:hypothetical protein
LSYLLSYEGLDLKAIATEANIHMVGLLSSPNLQGPASPGGGGGSFLGMPRWVKAFSMIAVAMVVLFAILHLTGAIHGGHAPPSGVMEHAGHQPSP